MKIKVSSGFSGKIPTGSYQNSNPSFYAEVEYETDLKGEALAKEIDTIQKDLHGISYQNFKITADAAKIEKIKNDLKGFRFYKTPNGEYISVTTFLNPDFKPWCSDEELALAIAEGNIAHARAAHFISTGLWVEPKMLEGVAPDLLLLKGRYLDTWNFPEFLKKYPITNAKNGVVVVNDELKYAGTPDGDGMFPLAGEKGGELVPTIFDFKRTPDKEKNFTQMAAYAKCRGMEHIEQMMIIPTNPDNAQGFSKPIISMSIDKYFELVVEKRRQFTETYGV